MTITSMTNNFRSAPIQLSEADSNAADSHPKEVQLLKVGKFKDSRYGNFEVTPKMLSEMVENFKKGIRGIKPAIDFKHDSEDKAAAWMKDVFTKDNGNTLWCIPDWTGSGKRSLSDRDFGYISAEFNQKYKDNEEGKEHGCVLLGAALTNRPVIKNMSPVIQLSEGDSMELTPEQKEKLAGLIKQYGVSNFDELVAKLSGMKPKEEIEKKEVELEEKEMQLSEKSKKLVELSGQVKTLSEENAKLKGDKVVSEKEATFNKMLSEGRAIPAQKEAFIAGDLMKFAELAPKGGVKVTEKGTEEGGQGDVNADDDDKVLKLAEAKVKAGEAKDIGAGISQVLKEQKDSNK